ncbi:hypothetical protein LTR66_002063 [Elasticomyces elasticus]|nr:hypothetical protein LTR28_006733 [Elasticomyces elasticus]KAK4998763.1 hypothetical protein LTR66_002063 [Elasticomyces elasticus]
MAAAIGKYAANKMLKKHMKEHKNNKVGGKTDPYFQEVPDPKRPGKFKKVKKQIPAYIPEHDANILAKVRKRSYQLDMGLFNFFGLRVGWSAVIGLVPAFGDIADFLLAMALVTQCKNIECGLPDVVLTRMYLNCLIDLIIGFVPFLGDLADAWFRANTMNVRLLEKRLDEVYKPTNLKEKDKGNRYSMPATAYNDSSDDEEERRHFVRDHDRVKADPVTRPAPARDAGNGRGWFSGSRAKQTDPEMGGEAPPSFQPPRADGRR